MAALMGMKDIQKHVNMSEATVLVWIRQVGFPAKKVGGIWISDTEAISRWLVRLIESDSPAETPPAAPPVRQFIPEKKQKNSRSKRT